MTSSKGEDLRSYVRRVMRQKGLTLRDIEHRSGERITDGYVSGIIAGTAKNPSVEKLKALADGLGVDVVELFNAACGAFDGSVDTYRIDTSHSLMVLDMMQKIISDPQLMDLLHEVMNLGPEDRSLVMMMVRSIGQDARLARRREAG
ncbi:MAG TPA: helix-turn-helix transcriptional regulator [Blastocatellia bacterium]|nr:helix-turn-helix transcriptional regulator [Blastocatellia bacterium]